jgi:hypothetical protein
MPSNSFNWSYVNNIHKYFYKRKGREKSNIIHLSVYHNIYYYINADIRTSLDLKVPGSIPSGTKSYQIVRELYKLLDAHFRKSLLIHNSPDINFTI